MDKVNLNSSEALSIDKSDEKEYMNTEINFRKHEKVELFLDELANQIHTEDEAKDIKDELYDHIKSSIDEYLDMEYSLESAVSKSLLSMGDPREIGYSFTNYDLMKKRKMLMYIFKAFGTAILMSIVMYIDYKEFIINGDQMGLTSMCLSLLLVYLSLKTALNLYGRPIRTLDIDTNPLFIIWPVKKKLAIEYKIFMFIFSPVPILFTFLIFYEGARSNGLLYTAFLYALFLLSVFMIIYSEKYRIPKYMIIEEGVVIKNRFTSWTAIEGYLWRSSKQDDKVYHSLKFTNNKRLSVTRDIVIGEKQKVFLTKLLAEKIYAK